jgi:hypothetical protein
MLSLILALVMALALLGCRKKHTTQPITPPPDDSGWILLLSTYRAPPLPRHTNDTLRVRAYDPQGLLKSGMAVHSTCLAGPNDISTVVYTTTDTVNKPWGSVSPLIYDASVDSIQVEIVSSWLSYQDSNDTLATRTLSFKLMGSP